MTEKIGLFTGSFDPLTVGHMDLITRASRLFDRLLVGIFDNSQKEGFLPTEERKRMVEEAAVSASLSNVEVIVADQELVTRVAERYGVTSLIRGLRGSMDLDYEANFDFYNKELAPDLETVYLLARPQYRFVSSSGVRELLAFGADISAYVPENVNIILEKKNAFKSNDSNH